MVIFTKKQGYTYKEFLKVLTILGYKEEPSKKELRMVHKSKKSIVSLPLRSMDETVLLDYLTAYSYQLYMQGVIKEEEDIATMLAQNRLETTQKAKA